MTSELENLFATCYNCQKQGNYWNMRSQKEPAIVNGKILRGCFTYSKYFCPISERKIRDKSIPLPENQERILIVDCLNGNQEEIREKVLN